MLEYKIGGKGVTMTNPNVLLSKDRLPNKVDLLKNRIDLIQKECEHDWRITRSVTLDPSRVAGVYKAGFNITLFCLKCSTSCIVFPTRTCPCCLGTMQCVESVPAGTDKYSEDVIARQFDGGEQMYRCTSCSLQVAKRIEIPYDK